MSQCDAPGLTPVDEALTRILREVTPIRESVVVPLDQACGRVLAADAISPMNVPPADNSAMDGYAINPGPVDSERTPGIVLNASAVERGVDTSISANVTLLTEELDAIIVVRRGTPVTTIVSRPLFLASGCACSSACKF